MAVRLSALHADGPLPPGIFLVLISVRGLVNPRTIVRLEGLGKLKKIHLIRIQSRNLPACSIVLQPTTIQHCLGVHTDTSSQPNRSVWHSRSMNASQVCMTPSPRMNSYVIFVTNTQMFMGPHPRVSSTKASFRIGGDSLHAIFNPQRWLPSFLAILRQCLTWQ
jgi:hypothetical protein